MIKHGLVSVGTTATALNTADTSTTAQRATLLVTCPSGGATVYLGGAGVTTTSYGYALAASGELSIDILGDEVLYAVVATSTQNVAVLKQGVK
jgi:hypothetical protein